MTAHNSFAMPLVSYTIRILDKATCKIMNFTGSLHSRGDIDRINVPRKQGGRGLTSIEDNHHKNNTDSRTYQKRITTS